MAKIWITEFVDVGMRGSSIPVMPIAKMDGSATQVVTFSSTTQSAALAADTRFVRVVSDADCHIAAGSSPTATTSDLKLTAGSAEYFGVTPGHKIAVIAAA